MKLLLDTHVLLWWLTNDRQLSKTAHQLIAEPTHVIFASAVSAWEIAIKKGLGKLSAPDNLLEAVLECGFQVLRVSFEHAAAIENLPMHHQDPFDRLLIAQARCEELIVLTHDKIFHKYEIQIRF